MKSQTVYFLFSPLLSSQPASWSVHCLKSLPCQWQCWTYSRYDSFGIGKMRGLRIQWTIIYTFDAWSCRCVSRKNNHLGVLINLVVWEKFLLVLSISEEDNHEAWNRWCRWTQDCHHCLPLLPNPIIQPTLPPKMRITCLPPLKNPLTFDLQFWCKKCHFCIWSYTLLYLLTIDVIFYQVELLMFLMHTQPIQNLLVKYEIYNK